MTQETDQTSENGQHDEEPGDSDAGLSDSDADFTDADFSDADFSGADFSGAGAGPGDSDAGDSVPYDDDYSDEEPYERPKVSKLAVVALITGVLALIPVALVTGIAALVGIRRSGRGGHGMAVTALFFAAGWLIIGGAFGTVAGLTHGFKKPVRVVYHRSAVFSLRTGECVDTPDSATVTQMPCAGPHDAEVFGTFTLAGEQWPGAASVQQQASAGCDSRLASYLNPQLAISLAQSYVYPNQVDWNAGTRTVICEVRAASGQLTESVRGGASSGS